MDLERVQKAAIRLILGEKYENYEGGLLKTNQESLKEKRKKLCNEMYKDPRMNKFSKKKH